MTLPGSSASLEMMEAFASAGLTVFERGWLSANNILFGADGPSDAVLVDSGYVAHAQQTLALVQRRLASKSLSLIINTHLHSDHCGGNGVLQNAFCCGIDVPAGEVHKVDQWDEAALSFRATGQRCDRFRRTGAVHAGDRVRLGPLDWDVIAAPGHDPESIMLFQPRHGILISADALWEHGFGVVFPELEGANAFNEVRDTLNTIGELQVRWVIPGHGRPFGDIPAALTRARARLSSFEQDPPRHATYAAKVLIKFHMLDVQRVPLAELERWLAETPYARLVHQRYFSRIDLHDWGRQIINDLARTSALNIKGEMIEDVC